MYAERGAPGEVLRVESIPLSASVGDDEIAVRMLAAPVNPSDLNAIEGKYPVCLLYTSPSPRDGLLSRMPSSA